MMPMLFGDCSDQLRLDQQAHFGQRADLCGMILQSVRVLDIGSAVDSGCHHRRSGSIRNLRGKKRTEFLLA